MKRSAFLALAATLAASTAIDDCLGPEPAHAAEEAPASGDPYEAAMARAASIDYKTSDIAYGEYLAQECVACHQLDAPTEGIPYITGMDGEAFVEAMAEYGAGARENAAMRLVAKSLGDEEIAALALYFESLE